MNSYFLIFSIGLSLIVCSSGRSVEQWANYINNEANAAWKAEANSRFGDVEEMQSLLGTWLNSPHKLPRKTFDYSQTKPLPKSFDSRKRWPHCKTIGQVRDQSSCGSCWAISAVETLSDRFCVHTRGAQQPQLSTRDLMSCCTACGNGCHGGYPSVAWEYFGSNGVVTGGLYNSSVGCQPYPLPHCAHHGFGTYPPCGKIYDTPQCLEECREGYILDYNDDKHFSTYSYSVVGEEDMMRELMERGPVQVAFTVYEDFYLYKSGVYHHVKGKMLGGHAVKLIGWGEENGVPYWLIVNSWNEQWAEKGLFRILRGKDECGIESEGVAGVPSDA